MYCNGQHTIQIGILLKIDGDSEAVITKIEKLSEIWNEFKADVIRNLYEKYANCLLDFKKAIGVISNF